MNGKEHEGKKPGDLHRQPKPLLWSCRLNGQELAARIQAALAGVPRCPWQPLSGFSLSLARAEAVNGASIG